MLSGVDFTVTPGSTHGLIGPNGSGKTTTLRAILAAQPASAGLITVDGIPTSSLSVRDLALSVAAVLQDEASVLPLSVWDTVLLGRSVHRTSFQRYRAEDTRIALAALERTGVTALVERSVLELSGGERQRVLIARALAQQAPYLLLDEPTNHLDVRFQHEVLSLVASLDTTTVVVLHDLNLAARYCDQLVLLDHGTVIADGTPDQVLSPDTLEAVYRIRARRIDDEGVPQLSFAALG
ncbi:ABC transporter ATP-binding protein [Leucobacter luti]|uniref:ABC transporter ATP-binding protein n=1 Tax=Leucobacter luti TaxID=340320 RepID=UPI003CFD3CB8